MTRLYRILVRQPFLACVVSLTIVVLGAAALMRLPVGDGPDLADPTILIRADLSGVTADALADKVAGPLEREIAGLKDLVTVSSRCSNDGRCTILAVFRMGTDVDQAVFRVRGRVERAASRLPAALHPRTIRVEARSQQILLIAAVASPDSYRDAGFLLAYAERNVADALRRVTGVGAIEVLGADRSCVKANLFPAAAVAVYTDCIAGSRDVAAGVHAALAELEESLPVGVTLAVAYDSTAFAALRLETAEKMLALAAALVVCAALALLQDLRGVLIFAAVSTVALAGTLVTMWLAGLTINPITLLGLVIAVGFVVDDGIAIVIRAEDAWNDNAVPPEGQQVGAEPSERATRTAVERAVGDAARLTVVAALIVLVLLLPAGAIGGISLRIAQHLLWPPAMAAAVSACVTMWISPAFCVAWLRPSESARSDRWMSRLFEGFASLHAAIVAVLVRRAALAVLIPLGVLVASTSLWDRSPKTLLPRADPGCLFVHARLPAGADLPRTQAVVGEIQATLLQTPEIDHVLSIAGYSALDNASASDVATCIVVLTPEARDDADFRAPRLAQSLGRDLQEVQDAICSVFVPIQFPGLGIADGVQMNLRDTGGAGPATLETAGRQFRDQAESSGVFAWSDVGSCESGHVDRVDGVRSIALQAAPVRPLSTVDAVVVCSILAAEVLPPEIEWRWSGLVRHDAESRGRWLFPMALAATLAYLFLVGLWRDALLPLAVLLAGPLAILGAILAARCAGIELDLYWQLGLLAAMALTGKMNVRFVTQARADHEAGNPIPTSAETACRSTFRLAATATGTIVLALTPLIFVVGAWPSEGLSLGTAVLGGMGSAGVLGMFAVPVLYAIAQWLSESLQRDRDEPLDSIWFASDAIRLLSAFGGYGSDSPTNDPPPDDEPASRLVPGRIYTVTGWIPPEKLGTTLVHEHLLFDPARPQADDQPSYDPGHVASRLREPLILLRNKGCRTLVDATPAGRGRNVALLRQISEESGVQVLTNTGYYGAEGGRFLPPHAFREDAAQLAERWLEECRHGIDDTDVRPGFIKIAVNRAPLSTMDQKLVRAAAWTHLESGLTIASHTPDAQAATEQLSILEREGVDPGAWIWVHAQAEPDWEQIVVAAERGAWVEFDGIGPETVARHIELVVLLASRKQIDRVLLSQNLRGYRAEEPRGQKIKSYYAIFKTFIPELFRARFGIEHVEQLMVINPMQAFTVGVRPLLNLQSGQF